VCLVDADNPALDAGRLQLRDMARLPWVAPYYRSNPNPPSVPVVRQLALLDIQPRIAVRVESYLAVPYFVAGTDRVALMQERLATRLAAQMSLKVLECLGDPEADRRGAVVAPAVRGRHRVRVAAPSHRGDRPPPLTRGLEASGCHRLNSPLSL
jgi:hypothetical protein